MLQGTQEGFALSPACTVLPFILSKGEQSHVLRQLMLCKRLPSHWHFPRGSQDKYLKFTAKLQN